jgi:hypothetical protein
MLKADYFETPVAGAHVANWWHELRTYFHSWLFHSRPGYRPYHVADSPMPMTARRVVA